MSPQREGIWSSAEQSHTSSVVVCEDIVVIEPADRSEALCSDVSDIKPIRFYSFICSACVKPPPRHAHFGSVKDSVHLKAGCKLFNPPRGTREVFTTPAAALTANWHSVNTSLVFTSAWQKNGPSVTSEVLGNKMWQQKKRSNCFRLGTDNKSHCCYAHCVKTPFWWISSNWHW